IFARDLTESDDNWWNGISHTKIVGKEGRDERHGHWITYYSNGQKALEGEYRFDKSNGKFTWWHPNGQKAIQGEYVDGKQTGRWYWWHVNGSRHIQGDYEAGKQAGAWTWWTDEGKVAEQVSFNDDGSGVVVNRPTEAVERPAELQATT